MPTARSSSAPVYIPSLGVLVLGGYGSRWLRSAELLQLTDDENTRIWHHVCPMNSVKDAPLAAYFESNVFVIDTSVSNAEVLSIVSGEIGQWTTISLSIDRGPELLSMCVFNGQLLVSRE